MRFDALRNGDSVFIDANIFIYNFGGQSVECKDVLLRCAKGELRGITSTFIIAEVLHRLMVAEAIEKKFITDKNPVKQLKEHAEIIKKLSTYIHDVEKIGDMNLEVLELTYDCIKTSAAVRRSEGILTNDSLVAAAMKDIGVSNLLTNDDDFDRIEWLHIYKPSDV